MKSTINSYYFQSIAFILLSLLSIATSAQTMIINGKTVINQSTTYDNVTLDMSHGYFYVTNNATLSIKNSKINGTISPDNPTLITINNGNLVLDQNSMQVTAENIPYSPENITIYNAIQIMQGLITITGNHFTIDKFYRAGFLITASAPIYSPIIKNNLVENFNGGIIMQYPTNAYIGNNKFVRVSVGNIFLAAGTKSIIENNTFLFSGNNIVGDAIDVIDSKNITIRNNYIASGSCYSIVIMRSQYIYLLRNTISDGITYGIYITDKFNSTDTYGKHLIALQRLNTRATDSVPNKYILINNNLLMQNRYGLTAKNVDYLTVINNIFIQRFTSNESRKFWTNNDVLFKNISNVVWDNNYYREAFTQVNKESNEFSYKWANIPLHGGVDL